MGLNFSHGGAQWSCGGFNDFRRRLAEQVGIPLGMMQGWGGTVPWTRVSDPIVPLLTHSDNSGDLAPDVCAIVALRLEELIAEWPQDGWDHDRDNGFRLAAGMRECARLGVPLVFR